MKRLLFIFSLILFIIFVFFLKIENANSWGFEAHKKITELAIDLLLNLDEYEGINKEDFERFKTFLYKNRAIIIDRCIEPDIFRNDDKDEQYNHYIDIDRYGDYPFIELPRDKVEAINKFGFDRVKKNGLLPWRIVEFTDSLAYSFSEGDSIGILKYLSWLAHYVEDAHQPLHVTENYDGQLTNQPGIHSRFETELIKYIVKSGELKFDIVSLSRELKRNSLVSDRNRFSFEIILESYKFIDKILDADNFARSQIPVEKLYRVEKRNGRTRYIYSEEYYSIMAEKLTDLIQERISKAAIRLALLWMNAFQSSLNYKQNLN